jgi:hypothetical protein
MSSPSKRTGHETPLKTLATVALIAFNPSTGKAAIEWPYFYLGHVPLTE